MLDSSYFLFPLRIPTVLYSWKTCLLICSNYHSILFLTTLRPFELKFLFCVYFDSSSFFCLVGKFEDIIQTALVCLTLNFIVLNNTYFHVCYCWVNQKNGKERWDRYVTRSITICNKRKIGKTDVGEKLMEMRIPMMPTNNMKPEEAGKM